MSPLIKISFQYKFIFWQFKIIHGNNNDATKADFMQKSLRRDAEGHYILIKGTIQQEVIIILNIYALNIGVLTFIKQTFLSLKDQI
jgi:hypothetical protein